MDSVRNTDKAKDYFCRVFLLTYSQCDLSLVKLLDIFITKVKIL
jgi:hypothetical protein